MEYMVKSLQWERFAAFNSLYAKFKHLEAGEADLTHLLEWTLLPRFLYENTPIQIYRKFKLQNLKLFR